VPYKKAAKAYQYKAENIKVNIFWVRFVLIKAIGYYSCQYIYNGGNWEESPVSLASFAQHSVVYATDNGCEYADGGNDAFRPQGQQYPKKTRTNESEKQAVVHEILSAFPFGNLGSYHAMGDKNAD